jgi:AAA domain
MGGSLASTIRICSSRGHLRAAATEAARIQREVAGPGKLFALLYTHDDDRARLLAARGYSVVFGGLDELVAALAAAGAHAAGPVPTAFEGVFLPTEIAAMALAVRSARTGRSNFKKVFYGSPATYADIHDRGTFTRKVEQALLNHLRSDRLVVSITGAAGVGKTTLARRLAYQLDSENWLALEQQAEMPIRSNEWLTFFQSLEHQDRPTVLVIDNATHHQANVNRLLTGLVNAGATKVKIILTAESHEWNARQKAAAAFSHGHIEHLSLLEPEDIRDLLRLAHDVDSAFQLMDRRFRGKSSAEQEQQLRFRCGADMFVCLKNIFATESLDTIILREYASLPSDLQDIYRYVAALHAGGAAAHRQLLLRLLGIPADGVAPVLRQLEDIIEEKPVDEAGGIYEWLTRHEVVAETLARYKFADQDELYRLLTDVIVSANPTVYIELQTLRGLCNWEFGIRRIEDMGRRIELYEAILRLAPSERVARHRLVAEYLSSDQFDVADATVNLSVKAVGLDAPLARYRVRLLIQKAERLPGILEADRKALLIRAKHEALDGVRRFPDNRFVYEVLGDVALAWKFRTKSDDLLEEALTVISKGADRILDPELGKRLRELERARGDKG